MVESSGAGPAIRAAEDRRVTMLAFDALQLRRHQVKRCLPADLHKRLSTTQIRCAARPVVQPTLAHHRHAYAVFGVQRVRDGMDDGGRIRVFIKRLHTGQATVFHYADKSAPMRRMLTPLHGLPSAISDALESRPAHSMVEWDTTPAADTQRAVSRMRAATMRSDPKPAPGWQTCPARPFRRR